MLYYSILFLIVFILILVMMYRYKFPVENFMTSGYVENTHKLKNIQKAVSKSEIETNNFNKKAGVRQAELRQTIDKLKKKQDRILQHKGSGLGYINDSSTSNGSDSALSPYKSLDNKELYSILVNGLNSPSSSAKHDFTTLIDSTVNVSCELLKQKYDYRYVDNCFKKTRGRDRAGEIHKLINRSYDYISQPKYNSTIKINPYLVNKLNKNIEEIIERGRSLIFDNSNTCQCKGAQRAKLLKTQFTELIQNYNSLKQQAESIKQQLADNNKGDFSVFGISIPTMPKINKPHLERELQTVSSQKASVISQINNLAKTIKISQKDSVGNTCKPC